MYMNKRLLFTPKYTIPALLVTIIALLSVWKVTQPLFGIFACTLYLLFNGKTLGSSFIPHERRFWRLWFGTIAVLCVVMILLSPIYWFDRFNQTTVSIVLVLLPLMLSVTRDREDDIWEGVKDAFDTASYAFVPSYLGTRLLALLCIWGEGVMFFVLSTKRYTDTLVSPWTIIGPRFFIVFALLTAMLFWMFQKSRRFGGSLFLITIHYLLFFTVALIVFAYGFGYDPFIHQTTEEWIATHEFILPKQPYYIGQYMLVLFLHTLTHLPISMIDKALVPVGASLLLPATIFFVFSRKDQTTSLTPAILFLLFFPLSSFIVTTPNNLALLLSSIFGLWLWYAPGDKKQTGVLSMILAGAALCIHPFIGLPLAVMAAATFFWDRWRLVSEKILFSILYILVLAITVPATIIANARLHGDTAVLQNSFSRLDQFLKLFEIPYWYIFDAAPRVWQIFYTYRLLILPCVVILMLLGIRIALKKYHEAKAWFFVATALGLSLSAFLLSTTIIFPNVISYEQHTYAKRLIELALLLHIPFFIITIREFFLWIKQKKLQLITAIAMAILVTISWYFTYPTRDPVSRYVGFNVRQADIDAVNFIADRNTDGTPYIVLSNQMVAAAALHEFGFEHYINTAGGEQYFYSIPTGGPLFQFFRKMVYQEPKRQWMEEAMAYAGVKKAYFVHTNYWAPAAEIRDKATLEADAWWDIDQGRAWVYEYVKK